MWKSIILSVHFVLLALIYCVPVTQAADALDALWEIQISESYIVKDNYLLRQKLEYPRDLHFVRDRSYNLLSLRPSLTVTAANSVSGYLAADVFWEKTVDAYRGNLVKWDSTGGMPVDQPDTADEEDVVDADITTAYLSFKGRHVSVDLGLQPVGFGNGLIMADDTLAASIDISVDDTYFNVKAARVMDHSPMVGLTLGYRPGHYERLEIFGIWYQDRDDTFAYSTPFSWQVFNDLSSEGDLYYMGAAAEVFVGDSLLTLVGAYQTGRYSIAYESILGLSGEGRADVDAYFADISLQRNLTDWCTVELFCFFASGDAEPTGDKLEAFVSVTPYNPRAAIFFDPDFLDVSDDQRFTYSGGFFNGVIAPGISLTFGTEKGFSAEAALIYMYAHESLEDGSQFYGWEVDVAVSYTIAKKYEFFLEAAHFEHGDYYESYLDEEVDPAMRLSFGLRAQF